MESILKGFFGISAVINTGVYMLKKSLIAASLVMVSFNAAAVMKVIYGKDNRVESRLYKDKEFRELAKSVAGRVSSYGLYDMGDYYEFPQRTLSTRMGVCSDQKFAQQYSVADCSGFLVGKDILVTAGHCIDSETDCSNYKWVFGYDDQTNVFKKSNVYSCKSIIDQSAKYNLLGYAKDFAVIKLDRAVEGRAPLKFRTKGKIRKSADILVIGHPSGLPTKNC